MVAFDATEVQPDEPVDVLGGVDGVAGEVGLQVVQLVRVGLLAEHGRAVVVGEGALDRVRVVGEVEHRDVVFLRVGPLSRERVCTALTPDRVLSTYMRYCAVYSPRHPAGLLPHPSSSVPVRGDRGCVAPCRLVSGRCP